MSKELNKRKYKIKIDGKRPSNAQIDRHKNFESLLESYKDTTTNLYRRPLYKNPKAFLFLFFIAVVVYLVWNAFEEEAQMKEKNEMAPQDTLGRQWQPDEPLPGQGKMMNYTDALSQLDAASTPADV